jgi:hypothetical protein
MKIGVINKEVRAIATCTECGSAWDLRAKTEGDLKDKTDVKQRMADYLKTQEIKPPMNEVILSNKIKALYADLERESKQLGGMSWTKYDKERWDARLKETINWLKLRGNATHVGKCPYCKRESVLLNPDSTVGQCIDPECRYVIAPEFKR